MSPDLYWIAVVLTTIVATARIIRLWTHDDFPPVAAVRNKFLDITEQHLPAWAPLGFCPWCVGFWIALLTIGTGWAAGVYENRLVAPEPTWGFVTWWVVAGALTVSYLAAMLMVRDGDDDETEAV